MRLRVFLVLCLFRGPSALAQTEPSPLPVVSPPTAKGGATPSAPGAAKADDQGYKEPTSSTSKPPGTTTVIEEITGTVASIDRAAQKVAISTKNGPQVLRLDRNTLVFTSAGLGTVLDLKPGLVVRAARNAVSSAYWIQVWPSSPQTGSMPVVPPPSVAASSGVSTEPGGSKNDRVPEVTAPKP